MQDGTRYVANPVNGEENYSEHRHEDDRASARALIRRLDALGKGFVDMLAENRRVTAKRRFRAAIGASAAIAHLGPISLTEGLGARPRSKLPALHDPGGTESNKLWRQKSLNCGSSIKV